MRNRGYYLNGLRAWREELQRSQKIGATRLKTMQQQSHPDAGDQELYLALRSHVIGLINMAEAEVLKSHQQIEETDGRSAQS